MQMTMKTWQPKTCPAAAKSLQSCPTLCDPIDGSPPGSPVPGILQARILESIMLPILISGMPSILLLLITQKKY